LRDFTGELKLNFYTSGLRLDFEQGRLVNASAWLAENQEEEFESSSFPPLVFLKLLFGYRSLEDLKYAYPDCNIAEIDEPLLRVLFPVQSSWLRSL